MTDAHIFFQLADPLFQRYNQGDYAGALEFAQKLATEYPDQAVHTYLWQICLTSRLNQTKLALTLMDEALKQGYWWSELQLRQDSDLGPLQRLPEFERLVTINNKQYLAAQADSKPGLRVLEPDSSFSLPYPLLIALHGRGHTEDDGFSPQWEPACKMGWIVALPRSSQLSWPGAYGWDDPAIMEDEIMAHYEVLCRQYPIDKNRTVVAGMSQGASIAIQLVMSGKFPSNKFVAVAPGTIDLEQLSTWAESAHAAKKSGRLIAGGKDYRYGMFLQVKEICDTHKIPLKFDDYPGMGHEFPSDFERILKEFLSLV